MARVLTPLRAEIAGLIRNAADEAGARRGIDHAIEHHAHSVAIANALFVPIAIANMAGQIAVHGLEAKVVTGEIGDLQDSGSFLGKPWQDAVDAFRARGIVSDSELSKLMRDYAEQSQEARSLMLERIQSRVHDMLATAIEDGHTFGQFADNLAQHAEGLGITVNDDSYLQTVFRTNVQSAYGAGRYKSFKDPHVQAERPYVQYRTVGDARVRDEHAALDGKVFNIKDPVWHRIAPPNGYNCRCSIVTLSEEDAKGMTIENEIPADYVPDPDFDAPPAV